MEPLKSQIMTGYMISKARGEFIEYIEQAFDCMKVAMVDTNEDLEIEAVQNVDLGDIRSSMYEALAAVENLEEAHRRLSKRYQRLGYRKLTSEDFKQFGARGR